MKQRKFRIKQQEAVTVYWNTLVRQFWCSNGGHRKTWKWGNDNG